MEVGTSDQSECDVGNVVSLIQFCIEQLSLCFIAKTARHYSPERLINAFFGT